MYTFEGGSWYVRDIRVQLLLRVFLIVTLTGDTHTEAVRNVFDTPRPYLLIERGVQANVSRTHGLRHKIFDGFDSCRGALFEGPIREKSKVKEC